MDLLMPESGLLFWMTIVFLIVFLILWKWGFPSIVKMVNERKAFIDGLKYGAELMLELGKDADQ